MTPTAILFIALDIVLIVVAFRRPWLGLVLLLAAVPFNGLLLDVVAPFLGVAGQDGPERIGLAAWHDALAAGIVLRAAAGLRFDWRPRAVEILGVGVLLWGAVALVRGPDLTAGLYAYRALFEPIALGLAIVVLARCVPPPPWLTARAAGALVGSALVAGTFAIWQVYVAGYPYLITYYLNRGRLPAAYLAAYVEQPRAIGTFHSPNEFGAFLVVAIVIAATAGLLTLGRWRPWIVAALAAVLLLTFSRSAWVGLAVAAVVGLIVTGWRPADGRAIRAARSSLAPLAAFSLAAALVLTTSHGFDFIAASLSGREPSAAAHLGDIGDILGDASPDASPRPSNKPGVDEPGQGEAHGSRIRMSLLGDGLGTAGPKASRFGGKEPQHHSEVWYVNYAAQVGLVGLAITLVFVIVALADLWRRRRESWPTAALAALLALGAGAVFIPVIDEPAVALPLWAVVGLGLLPTVRATEGRP